MLIPVPPPYRPRRSRGKRRTQAAPAGLMIASVTLSESSDYQLVVTFSAPVTWNGVDVPAEFQATTSDGPGESCINVVTMGPDWIEVEFNGSIEVGADWSVDSPMSGISPIVAAPQSGVVS